MAKPSGFDKPDEQDIIPDLKILPYEKNEVKKSQTEELYPLYLLYLYWRSYVHFLVIKKCPWNVK